MLKHELNNKTRGELNIIAKEHNIDKYRQMSRSDLIDSLLKMEIGDSPKAISVTWWGSHCKHVYGIVSIIGLVFTVLYFDKAKVYITEIASVNVYSESVDVRAHMDKDAPSENSVARNAISIDEEDARIAVKSDSFSSISVNGFFSRFFNAGSSLQRDELENQLLGRTVIWNGYVQAVENSHENSIQIIVGSGLKKTLNKVYLNFDEKYREDLLQLNEGDFIRFTGVIRRIFIGDPYLENCRLLNH